MPFLNNPDHPTTTRSSIKQQTLQANHEKEKQIKDIPALLTKLGKLPRSQIPSFPPLPSTGLRHPTNRVHTPLHLHLQKLHQTYKTTTTTINDRQSPQKPKRARKKMKFLQNITPHHLVYYAFSGFPQRNITIGELQTKKKH